MDPPTSLRREVVLHGYLGERTDLSRNFYFVPLLSRDLCHSIQIVSNARSANEESQLAHETLKSYEPNSPVVVKGVLKDRVPPPSQDVRRDEKVKPVEIELRGIQCLNEFPKDILTTSEKVFPPEQRHLQLRSDKVLRDAIAFRSRAVTFCRNDLNLQGFVDVETPILFKSTPEGAREFIVPTRRKGLAYALPQSPQQFKQILMASGISRYYQIARCFRDEDLRADRQPEFTQVDTFRSCKSRLNRLKYFYQLDLEMSFASGEDVMLCIESLVRGLWKEMLNISLPCSFPRITYTQAMAQYGSDKPDTRPGMQISRLEHLLPVDLISKITPLINPIVEAFIVRVDLDAASPQATRNFISKFMDSPDAIGFNENPEGGPGIFIYDSKKPLQGLQPFGFEAAEEIEQMFEPEDGDLIILQARKNASFSGGSTPIGDLRLALYKAAVKEGYFRVRKGFQPLWVTDFPLFSPSSQSEPGQGGAAGLSSTHHPFTSPKSEEDVDLLLTDPSKVIGDHYDLVVNGVELGGGSRRIHNAEMQKFVMQEILQMTPERISEFSHLLEVLRAGCPPHAGIALGFDRLIALMLGKESVKDVIAFPKSSKGEDVLVNSPGVMSEEVLKTYHLRLR